MRPLECPTPPWKGWSLMLLSGLPQLLKPEQPMFAPETKHKRLGLEAIETQVLSNQNVKHTLRLDPKIPETLTALRSTVTATTSPKGSGL